MNHVRRALIAAVAFAGFLPPIANASTQIELRDARTKAAEFADCVTGFYAPLARATILEDLTSEEIVSDRSVRQLIDCECVNGRLVKSSAPAVSALRFGGDLFRYSLANALIKRDYPLIGVFDFSNVPPLEHFEPVPLDPAVAKSTDAKAKQAQARYSRQVTVSLMSRFGECVSRRNPFGAQKLALSTVNSTDETAAFSELSQAFGECLSSGQLRLSRDVARGLVALNFYRLAGAPAGAEVAKLKGRSDA